MVKAIFIMGPVYYVHMLRNQRCRGRGGPGRPVKPRILRGHAEYGNFHPSLEEGGEPVIIEMDEVEALRLVDYLGLNQEEAANSMGVSRGTVWRCVDSGRRKLITMVMENRSLLVGGEDPSGEID